MIAAEEVKIGRRVLLSSSSLWHSCSCWHENLRNFDAATVGVFCVVGDDDFEKSVMRSGMLG